MMSRRTPLIRVVMPHGPSRQKGLPTRRNRSPGNEPVAPKNHNRTAFRPVV